MRYTTKIELPVKTSKCGNYILSDTALRSLLEQLKTHCNIINIEWNEGNCFATLELFSPVQIKSEQSTFESFVGDVVNQINRRNS